MIYFDNAATTYPKPHAVKQAVIDSMEHYGANPGRSGHTMSLNTAVKVFECREAVAKLFGCNQVEDVIFTSNCTNALNIAIKGVLLQDDHVIISDIEHNSVLRPVHTLARRGVITYDVATTCINDTNATVAAFERLITPKTKLIACAHGSNAFGIKLPIKEIGQMAKRHGVLFLVDAAQSAGVVEINMQKMGIDFLCTAGHKSLFGPSGTGLLLTPHGSRINTLIEGGTGSMSTMYDQPEDMPERLESGTVNTMGIIGLDAGIGYISSRGLSNIYLHEMHIVCEIYRFLSKLDRVVLYTPLPVMDNALPVLSFNIHGMASEQTVAELSDRGFALRGGLHCSPLAHTKMSTLESGTARISISDLNNMQQAEKLCNTIRKIAQ